jgi:hypothetical protein
MCRIRDNEPPTLRNISKKANDVVFGLDALNGMLLSSIEHLLSWRYGIKIIG